MGWEMGRQRRGEGTKRDYLYYLYLKTFKKTSVDDQNINIYKELNGLAIFRGLMLLQDTICHQTKSPLSAVGYLFGSCWSQGPIDTPKIAQAVVISLGYPQERDGKTLSLKILESPDMGKTGGTNKKASLPLCSFHRAGRWHTTSC